MSDASDIAKVRKDIATNARGNARLLKKLAAYTEKLKEVVKQIDNENGVRRRDGDGGKRKES